MFLRFVSQVKHPDTGVEAGVFTVAYDLRDSGQLQAHEQKDLEALLAWFANNLEEPTRFNKTRSKGWYRRATKGVSWFKPTAIEHISKMRELAAFLEQYGHHVRTIKQQSPGYVVYEDEHQVVAEPFADQRS